MGDKLLSAKRKAPSVALAQMFRDTAKKPPKRERLREYPLDTDFPSSGTELASRKNAASDNKPSYQLGQAVNGRLRNELKFFWKLRETFPSIRST